MLLRRPLPSSASVLSVGLLLASVAQAQTPPPAAVYGEMTTCRKLRDLPARVACYDAIRLPDVASVAPVATPAPASRPAASAPNAPADFGLPPPPSATQASALLSRIAGRFEGWGPGTRLRLANGQIWEVVDGSSAAYDLDAPEVQIRRGVLGSYFLEVSGVSATPRVRRVQ